MLVKSQDLQDLYYNFIKLESSGIGLDKKSKSSLERTDLSIEYFDKMAQEINTKSYRYIPYKENLILKGRNSFPRVISIPTYRDKIVLKYLSKELLNNYYSGFSLELAQEKIEKICYQLDSYEYFIKLDLVGFYDNINHHILLRKLEVSGCPEEVLTLIENAISNPTVHSESSRYEKNLKNIKGVNQGLSISSIINFPFKVGFSYSFLSFSS
ncbi:reverse transcriptase domain-containing protein [uncultured Ilyobacter sp.]|uniref:reverse transcriptase domain-containing protein n=1 Tax=uncultured Ilyobacter sp. TaxID=544433 RepID=UPI0029F4A807|nr:reverse transcriptase domain-containing protein [uncultured Ilyobacter sp.]